MRHSCCSAMKLGRVGFAVGMVVVKCAFFLVILMAAAQPAAATQVVNLAAPESAAVPTNCPAQDPACTAIASDGAGANGASETESSGTGPIIAGLLGLLLLGAVFGRRKPGLPEVVS
jgi:hypothetical protein